MRLYAPAASLADFRDTGGLGALVRFVSQALTIADAEVRKLRHDPYDLATRAVQPTLWLLIFGQVMARVRGLTSGSLRYLDFMAPGILAQSVLFIAIFYGISIIWERDLGVLHKYLVSPASRVALVLGKAFSASVRAMSMALIVYVLALLLGVSTTFRLTNLLGVVMFVVLGSALFSTLSMILACAVKTRERFMGIGQVLTMPLFFASNAIYPLSLMPSWLQRISAVNPLTYMVDALRYLMVRGASSTFGLGIDLVVLVITLSILVQVAARLYPRMVI